MLHKIKMSEHVIPPPPPPPPNLGINTTDRLGLVMVAVSHRKDKARRKLKRN